MIDSSSESVASAIKQMCGEAQPCCGELAKLWNLESIAYVAILFPFSLHLQKCKNGFIICVIVSEHEQ